MSDLIDRQAAIDAMAELQGKAITMGEFKGISKAWNRITELPPAELERKKGKWENYIADTGVEHWRVIRCSECEKVAIERYNYCPHCGAHMREEK